MKILFLVPYPPKVSPSQRFRFEQYFSLLPAAGHTYEVQSFLKPLDGNLFFQNGNHLRKAYALARGFTRRVLILFRLSAFDRVFIHREALPVGPPLIEWIITIVWKKKVIFDFDDAIWLTDRVQEPRWLKLLKWRTKAESICRWSHKVSAGNEYLCKFARQFNRQVIYNPSTIDTEKAHNPNRFPKSGSSEILIGWIGSHSTLKYVEALEGVFQKLEKKYPRLKLVIIADQLPQLSLKSIQFIPWSAETEIEELSKIDIGIMPLPDDEWSKGKCGFKALQYMSLEKPALVSPVGVNSTIVDHGVNGYLCGTDQAWLDHIEHLIQRKDICQMMGKNGRAKVTSHYSVISNAANFLSLFE